jgi:hypothetical protein
VQRFAGRGRELSPQHHLRRGAAAHAHSARQGRHDGALPGRRTLLRRLARARQQLRAHRVRRGAPRFLQPRSGRDVALGHTPGNGLVPDSARLPGARLVVAPALTDDVGRMPGPC